MKEKKIFIKYIIDTKKIKLKNNIILVAFNLAFAAFFFKNIIKLNKHLIVWPDGIFSKIFFKNKLIPGYELIEEIKIPNKIKKLIILGGASKRSVIYLKKKFKKKITIYDLPYGKLQNIYKKLPIINKNYLYLITLPTPVQEKIAIHISRKYRFFKIICLGGGLAMASGEIKKSPNFIRYLGLEFAWRLRTDFFRRSERLLVSVLYFAESYKKKFWRKINFIKIDH
jgi:UDP-N-acetyl-D-mannosaminuronic acid transferase (WecB/TagA/CpsF family)